MKKPSEKQLKYWESMKGSRRAWKDDIKKQSIHRWLYVNYGSPRKCEICGDEKKVIYDWANKDHKYRRKREDFMRLCRSCHRKYDINNNLTRKRDRNKLGMFSN